MCLLRLTLGATIAALIAGCAGNISPLGSSVPNAAMPPQASRCGVPCPRIHDESAGGYVYVSNHTTQGASELLVYPEGTENASPMRTITQGLSDVAGVAVDSSGDVYVANGSGGNVLEYAAGGGSLVQTYSQGLAHPVGIAVWDNTLYVADQGNAANGNLQRVLEYTLGNPTPSLGIGGPGDPPQLNDAIAVDPAGTKRTFFTSASTLTATAPGVVCTPYSSYFVAQNLSPTLWRIIPLANNAQVSGLAFDANANLYAADVCRNDIMIYSNVSQTWTYSGKVPGSFDAPSLLTVNDQLLAIPSSGTASQSGYVTVIDLSGKTSTITITKGLAHPLGAAATAGS